MDAEFVSTTKLQRKPKETFNEGAPFKVVLKNDDVQGMVVNRKTTKILMKSGILQELGEELWEINDKETQGLIDDYRNGEEGDMFGFDDFRKEYGV